MTLDDGTVYVVDDDPGVLEAMEDFLTAAGKKVVVYKSATEYVNNAKVDTFAVLSSMFAFPTSAALTFKSS